MFQLSAGIVSVFIVLILLVGYSCGATEQEIDCYDCKSLYQEKLNPFCLKNDSVNVEMIRVSKCTSACFMRSDLSNEELGYRGCTATQWGFPDPLPPDGCYMYEGQQWCICSTNRCNDKPLGKGDVQLDAHLFNYTEELEEGEQKQCHVCRSHDIEGKYYSHCPKDGRVNYQKTWKENCTGSCFTRSDDLNDELVFRGCTDNQWGLPNPLPPNGCYKWYIEIWCICDTHLCNNDKIGFGTTEFDAHIVNDSHSYRYNTLYVFIVAAVLTLIH